MENLQNYPHHMLREIHEQPDAVQQTIELESGHIAEVAGILQQREIHNIIVAARGTSDNAANYARYLFGVVNGKIAAPAAPSIITVYESRLDLSNTLVLGISQSGKATDVIEVLESARHMGALTLAVTNTSDSPICRAAEHTILTHADPERSIAATKTYTTCLSVLYLLAAMWADDTAMVESLAGIPERIEETFDIEAWIADHAERYRYMEQCTILARGLNYATAMELGLKLAQCCHVSPLTASAADYMHGPIAALEPGDPVFLFAPQGHALGSMLEVAHAVRNRKAEIVVFSDDDDALSLAHLPMKLPGDGSTHWWPIIAAVASQLFTYFLAIHKGLNPDRPRGQQKVTLTY